MRLFSASSSLFLMSACVHPVKPHFALLRAVLCPKMWWRCYKYTAFLLCVVPNYSEKLVSDPGAVSYRKQGGDSLLWLPGRTDGCDYDKSRFHFHMATVNYTCPEKIGSEVKLGLRGQRCLSSVYTYRNPGVHFNTFLRLFKVIPNCFSLLLIFLQSKH